MVSCTALIAGTTVGAGVLALPSVTFSAGIIPSTLLLILIWGYTLVSGLLIAEVNVRLMQRQGSSAGGLLRMIDQFLGRGIAQGATLAFLFLHYALLVAYVSEGGSSLRQILQRSGVGTVPPGAEVFGFTALLGSLVYFASQRWVTRVNNVLVGGVVLSFLGLIGAMATRIHPAHLALQNWWAAVPAVPVMLVALFYHNVIPVVTRQLAGDPDKIRRSLILGSLIPLLMFLIWNGVVLGSVGPEAIALGQDPLDLLRQHLAQGPLGIWVTGFSLFAVTTSFIGVSYGLISVFQDLWSDQFGNETAQDLATNALVFIPPVGFCSLNPDLFIAALSSAGTFSVSTLYGLIPALLAWRSRYGTDDAAAKPWVPGGRWLLGGMMAMALGIVAL
ncbi:amino acid permease [Lyngbya confervoides]|uniref:Tyrosine transporter n=1 Tax=Lyngbya confervoides BDU141951 TaxID=1574623 RepID=A0ABD4T6W0_9CYAN|nr:aromatic amino acid transport family protein [Lyngbya confervoides]MCM1983997.1 hypothetical protein [Lyngbya confervoides BDU141951]